MPDPAASIHNIVRQPDREHRAAAIVTFQDFMRLTWRRIGTILLCALLGVGLAAGYVWRTPPRYTASTTAYVRVRMPASDERFYSAASLATQKAKAYVPLFTSTPVAEGVVSDLKLGVSPAELAGDVEANLVTDSLTIEVRATSDSPGHAQAIANDVVKRTGTQVQELEGRDSPMAVVPMASAALESVQRSPTLGRSLPIGLLAGLLAGYLLAFLRERSDTRIRTSQQIAATTGLTMLGVLPDSPSMARDQAARENDSQVREGLRKIRTNLQFASVDEVVRSVVVTSSFPSEGKSSVAAHLAAVVAQAGRSVVLVDADLRRPTVGATFGLEHRKGLAQLLTGTATLEDALHATTIPGLSILPAGRIPPNPSEILGSRRMQELLHFLAQTNFVVVDAPPLLPVTDPALLSKDVDGVVLVVRAGKTRTEHAQHAKDIVTKIGGRILGVVLNRVSKHRLERLRYGDAEYGYGYGYGYEQEYESTEHPQSSSSHPATETPVPATPQPTPAGEGSAPSQSTRPTRRPRARAAAGGVPASPRTIDDPEDGAQTQGGAHGFPSLQRWRAQQDR